MIFHAEKQNGFVMVDKAALNNPVLSMRAKGLLCYLLSKPPDWRPQVKDICAHCKERPTAIRSALSELRKLGYAKLLKDNGAGGKINGSRWIIIEKPSTEIKENRNSVFPHLTKNNKYNKNEAYPDLQNWPDPDSSYANTPKEKLMEEVKFFCKRILVNGLEDPFWEEWMRRGSEAPFRTLFALQLVEEDMSIDRFTKKTSVKNPSGKADWYFRHLDLKTRKIKK